MAARVGLAAVSYGIGVQNRYSAFLDDDDSFASGHQAKRGAEVAAAVASAASKQKGLQMGAKSVLVGKAAPRAGQPKQDGQPSKGGQAAGRGDVRRQKLAPQQLQRQQGANLSVQAQNRQASLTKPRTNNQDYTANGNKAPVRAQISNSNQHHQSSSSQQTKYTNHKDNNQELNHQTQGKFPRNNNGNNYNPRNNNRRQFYNNNNNINTNVEDKRSVQNFDFSSGTANIGPQSIEEEKRRRQQKRALDLKHKDPERREARRQQVALSEQQSQQATDSSLEQAQGENNYAFKGQQRNRRQPGERNNDENANRGIGGVRGRGRREQGASDSNEMRDGQQANRFQRADRAPRNRNGFGTGSRGSRGSRGDENGKFGRDMDRQKLIPNFSDKLDFPSLAS